VRVCLVYDHFFPHTVGGTERWMRDLAASLAARGHEVTFLTMRHWDSEDAPSLPCVRVLGLVEPGRVYRPDQRAFGPPVRFGLAVARHLVLHGREYDVVHTAAFPYFPLLAAGALRRRGGYRIVVDWHEVWTAKYWRHYAGALAGTIGWLVQRLCIKIPQRAFCVSQLHAGRLVAEGFRGEPTVLPGEYAGPVEVSPAEQTDGSLVVYAGRHVKEKRVDAVVRAFQRAREDNGDLRLELYGDGPELPRVEALVCELGLEDSVRVAGRRPEEEVAQALARAGTLVTASEREGYGLVVVEAAARGTPSVVVAGPENAATELVSDGVNGTIAESAEPEELAAAMLRVLAAGQELRASTAHWFEANASRLRLDRSIEVVAQEYCDPRVEDFGSPSAQTSGPPDTVN
jgi:glycosyltransferase involved in cell wall biosynthesis